MAKTYLENLEKLHKEIEVFFESLKELEERLDKKARKELNEKVKEVAYRVVMEAMKDKALAIDILCAIALQCARDAGFAKKTLKAIKDWIRYLEETGQLESEIWLDVAADLTVPK